MHEVEMKFTNANFVRLKKKLAKWGARADPPQQDADHYFNAPDRDFAQTDEALRVRRIGSTNRVTYKGPKRDLHTKTRTEIEVAIAKGDLAAEAFMQLLMHLGYRPVAVVRKRRQIFHLKRGGFAVEICLDELKGLGRFAEVEVKAPDEKLDAAQALMKQLAAELGLTTSERRSYLELLLESSKESSS